MSVTNVAIALAYFLNYSMPLRKILTIEKNPIGWHFSYSNRMPYKFSISLSQIVELASLGILQSPLGLIEILPTLGPSGRQERLNC